MKKQRGSHGRRRTHIHDSLDFGSEREPGVGVIMGNESKVGSKSNKKWSRSVRSSPQWKGKGACACGKKWMDWGGSSINGGPGWSD